ncbi:MAG: hypothetical protein ACJASB_001812, partial [Shewanella psychromarinicola]|uniref:FG-GAP repeat protein n=1 Tax=Shewanella psychromarinicola TaxID=2487742 RepID=UPI003EEE0917
MSNVVRQFSNHCFFELKFKIPFIICLLMIIVAPLSAEPEYKQHKLLSEDGATEDGFGYSVAISGNTALVGSNKSDSEIAGDDVGAAYIYTLTNNGWRQQAKLTAEDGLAGDTLGGNVALFENIAVVGAIGDDGNGENSGAVYVFERTGSDWTQQAKLIANDGAKGDAFGQSIAVSSNTIVIGAPHEDASGDGSGSIYIFNRIGSKWSQRAKLNASDGLAGDLFGISVAIFKDTLLVGADLHDAKATDAGAVYVFTKDDASWRQQAKLMAEDAGETDIFGVRVALHGDTALISARRDDDDVMGVDAGSAYVFVRTGTKWLQQAKLTAPDGSSDDRFGRGVALSENTVI